MILPRIVNASIESPAVPLTDVNLVQLMGGGAPVASGATVTPSSSLGVSAVWRAVNLISGTIASLPLHAYRPQGEGRVRVTTGWGAELVEQPHRDLTPFEWWEFATASMLLWGNAYFRMDFSRGGASRWLLPILPDKVKVGRASDGTKVYDVAGEPLTDDAILHLPGFGYDGICGVSPIRAARQGIGLALSSEEYAARLFGSGSLATGLLQTEQRLTPEQADLIQARWAAKRSGLGSAHGTIVLDSGAKFHQLTIPPVDAQFLESRAFQVSEVARIFGVPPHMLMDTEKSTSWGTGIEQQSIGWVVYTLRPWLTRLEQRITKLVRPSKLYVKFRVEGLLRGDSAQRAAFYRAMWSLGALSTNEIRALEDMDPVEGGDVRYRPLNMGVLGTADSANVPDPADPVTTQEATSA